MKIIHSNFKNQLIKIRVEANDDLYFLSKIITPKSEIEGVTYRKIKKGAKETAVKKKCLIKIIVEKTEFRDEPLSLRANGKIIKTSDDDIPMGSYHTISIEEGKTIKIGKKFLAIDKKIIEKAAKKSEGKKILLAVIDYGEAHFGILTRNKIKKTGSFEKTLGRKESKEAETNRERYLTEFLEKVSTQMESSKADIAIIGCVGFISESLNNLIKKELKQKVRLTKVSTSTVRGLNELVKRGEIGKIIRDDEVSKESALVEEFFDKLNKNSKKVCYGLDEIKEKAENGAIEYILVSDKLVLEEAVRNIIDIVEDARGKVEIISSEHDSGDEFYRFGGLGAFLRF